MARWLTPDWAAREEAVPYSDLTNPQTLNLYAYVGNNPTSRTDPDGHFTDVLVGRFIAGETVAVTAEAAEAMDQKRANDEAKQKEKTNSEAQQETRKPPPVPVPGAPNSGWKWSPDANNPRGGTWTPTDYPKTETGSRPSASYEPGKDGKPGHWDVDDGTGKRQRYNDAGKPITPGEAHASSSISSQVREFVYAHPVATGVAAGVVIVGVVALTGGTGGLGLAAAAAAF